MSEVDLYMACLYTHLEIETATEYNDIPIEARNLAWAAWQASRTQSEGEEDDS